MFVEVGSGAVDREEKRLLFVFCDCSFLAGEAGTDWDFVLSRAFSAVLRPALFSFFEFLISSSS